MGNFLGNGAWAASALGACAMSDEADATTPESGASAEAVSVEPVSEPGADAGTADTGTATADRAPADTDAEEAEPVPPGRWSRMLPTPLRRRPLITAIAAVGLAAFIAVLVLAAVQPSTPRPAYSSLPKQPCSLISPAELATFLPGAKGTVETVQVASSVRIDTCKWSSTTGGDDQTLVGQVFVFGSSSSISDAQQSYRATVSRLRCHCKGVTISTRPVRTGCHRREAPGRQRHRHA